LAAISLATVPVTPMTFGKFNFKFANPSKSYEIHKTRIRRYTFTWSFELEMALMCDLKHTRESLINNLFRRNYTYLRRSETKTSDKW
jgi:hypothetical protein